MPRRRRGGRSPSASGGRSDRSRSPPRRRRRRRTIQNRSPSGSRSPSRRPSPRRGNGRGGRGARSPSKNRDGPDRRPLIEREKGGVKLFVGRLPRETTQRVLRECFEEFGEVLEVFVIDSKAISQVGCAFIRMGTVAAAEDAMESLHEQRVLIPDQRELGPMQVAFAKGEAVRLGIDEKEEILPSFKEARMKVVEHNEKRQFFETMQKSQEDARVAMQEQHKMMARAANAGQLPTADLISVIKDGQRFGGQSFKMKWWSYCDQGWGGTYDYDPSHHAHETLAQFVTLSAFEHGQEPWFSKPFHGMPVPMMPPLPPGPVPPGFGGGMGGGPPGMGPPPFGPPGMAPPPFGPPGMGGPPRFGPPGGYPPHGGPHGGPRIMDRPRAAMPPKVEEQRMVKDYADVDKLSDSDEEVKVEDINMDDI